MEQQELKQKLSANYDLTVWKELLSMLFNKIDYFTQPAILQEINLMKSGGQIGNIRLDDGKNLALFEVEVADTVSIAKNRKGLRDIAAKYIDQGIIHGALVFFYSKNQKDYRLTYIAKQAYINEEGEFRTNETAPKRYTYLLGENETCTTAAIRLLALASKKRKSLSDVTETFSVEKLNKEFFDRYKEFYKKFCFDIILNVKAREHIFEINKELDFNDEINKPIRDFVKKMMGRIVFLHFLQKKNWMGCPPALFGEEDIWGNGDKEFMLSLFNNFPFKKHFYSQCLVHLFFSTLNTNRGDAQMFELTGTRVPYLNGGLFDEDMPKARQLDFSATLFSDFLQFFAEYNFTIDENSPDEQEVGIDPEMLGHIFENLLEDNKDKGAYYTPKEIVHFMCQESLIEYLDTNATNCDVADIKELIRHNRVSDKLAERKNATEIDRLLQNVKICDPAIGSGAFPLGMLKEIFECRRLLYGYLKTKETFSPISIKKEIIQNSIYGVDIEKGAVDIARLRFWLALVVDEIKPEPLPNLDYKIVTGNSLISQLLINNSKQIVDIDWDLNTTILSSDTHRAEIREGLKELSNCQRDFFIAKECNQTEKEELKKNIRVRKLDILIKQLNFGKLQYITNNHPIDKLFELKTSEIKRNAEIKIKKEEFDYAISELQNLQEDSEQALCFFDWMLDIPEVMNELVAESKGFDIVIGNPPYLRIQGIREDDEAFANELCKKYDSATGSFDLYAIFTEKALSIVKENSGIVNFIMPVKWTNAAFGKGLRTVMSNKKAASKIINFGAYQVFNASTYTGLQWFKPNSDNLSYIELDRNLNTNEELGNYLEALNNDSFAKIANTKLDATSWILTADNISKILDKLNEHPRRMRDVFGKIFQGLATSKDDVYFLYKCKEQSNYIIGYSKELEKEVKIELTLMKPLLKGEDVHRYDTIASDRFVLFPYKLDNESASLYTEDELASLFPLGYAYLRECEVVLKGREKGRLIDDSFWYKYIYPKNLVQFANEKLVAPDISMGGNFAYDQKGEFYSTTTIYGYIKKESVTESYKFWMALLNSKLCWWFLVNTGTTLANGYFRFKPDYINPFPVPTTIETKAVDTIERLVDYMIHLKHTETPTLSDLVSNQFIANYFQEVIDACVYELYFGEHMKERELNILDDLSERIVSISNIRDGREQQIILSAFLELNKTENLTHTRIKLFTHQSPEYLKPIIQI